MNISPNACAHLVMIATLAFGLLTSSVQAQAPRAPKRLVILLPNDFMWPEYHKPLQAYRNAGIEVLVASIDGKSVIPDARNIKEFKDAGPVKADLSFKEVDVSKFDAVTTVGGNGAWHDLFPNPEAHRIVKQSLESHKVTGLICASTGILALIDNLDGNGHPIAEGRRVVGYFRVEGMLRTMGAVKFAAGEANAPTVVTDDNLITGRNPQASEAFGKAVIEALVGSGKQSDDR
jgi:putative intracellular protease/amidase